MYNLYDIFYEDNEYPARAEWCNENKYVIVEIEPDTEGLRRFQIQAIPQATQQELYQQEYDTLKQQLAYMDYKTSKYVDGEYTEEEWKDIVTERKQIRVRVRELEQLLNIKG